MACSPALLSSFDLLFSPPAAVDFFCFVPTPRRPLPRLRLLLSLPFGCFICEGTNVEVLLLLLLLLLVLEDAVAVSVDVVVFVAIAALLL